MIATPEGGSGKSDIMSLLVLQVTSDLRPGQQSLIEEILPDPLLNLPLLPEQDVELERTDQAAAEQHLSHALSQAPPP